MQTSKFGKLAATVVLLAGSSCSDQGPVAPRTAGNEPLPRLAPGRLTLHDDPVYLESRLVRSTRPLLVTEQNHGQGRNRELASTSLTLVGELLPPVVDGHVVQANDIDLDPLTRTAVIGYNMAGEVFAGALQVVDFRDAARPVLIAEVLFHDADVDAVLKKGTYYYAGLACSDPTLPTPAMLREFRQFTAGFGSTGQWIDLPSWSVTDLTSTGNSVIAACGAAQGALVHIDRTTMRIVSAVDEMDARAVCFDASGDLLGVCGTGILVRRALPDLAERARAFIDGYAVEAAKGTIEAFDGRCYLGAGDGGFQVLDADGNLLEALDNDSFEGIASNLAVTNAASVRGNLAFVAAGALGVQVVDLGRWAPGVDPNGGGSGLVVLGQVDFGDDVSSNMVKARSDILVVAGGLGGVKLVRMTVAATN